MYMTVVTLQHYIWHAYTNLLHTRRSAFALILAISLFLSFHPAHSRTCSQGERVCIIMNLEHFICFVKVISSAINAALMQHPNVNVYFAQNNRTRQRKQRVNGTGKLPVIPS